MDAAERLEPLSSETLREEIHETSDSLIRNVELLRETFQRRAEQVRDSFHVRARIGEHPIAACLVGIGAGWFVARSRLRKIPTRIAVSTGRRVGSAAWNVAIAAAVQVARNLLVTRAGIDERLREQSSESR